jgi:S1-C subfamily serine protease
MQYGDEWKSSWTAGASRMAEKRWPKVGEVLTHRFRDGRTVKAKVVDVDPENGVVAVEVDGKRYRSLS